MQTPLQLTFRGMEQSDALATHLRERAGKLEHFCDRIVSCHVVVERSSDHHGHGSHCRFSINVGLPGHEVVVTHAPREEHDGQNAYPTADRAFGEVERQIEHWVKRQREHRHDAPASGSR